MSERKIIVGLGNPGREYSTTWHNLGFMATEYFAQKEGLRIQRLKHRALIATGQLGGQAYLLLQPQTYMNESGWAVAEAMQYYKLGLEDLLVVYDDLDLPVGAMRMRRAGGPGTHNGMRSLCRQLGREDFPRLRLGMGPKPAEMDLAAYVLSAIPKAQQETVFGVLDQAYAVMRLWLTEGVERAMLQANQRPHAVKKATEEATHGT